MPAPKAASSATISSTSSGPPPFTAWLCSPTRNHRQGETHHTDKGHRHRQIPLPHGYFTRGRVHDGEGSERDNVLQNRAYDGRKERLLFSHDLEKGRLQTLPVAYDMNARSGSTLLQAASATSRIRGSRRPFTGKIPNTPSTPSATAVT